MCVEEDIDCADPTKVRKVQKKSLSSCLTLIKHDIRSNIYTVASSCRTLLELLKSHLTQRYKFQLGRHR